MVDTTTHDSTTTVKDTSTSSQSSLANENETETSNEELQRAIAGGVKLIRMLEESSSDVKGQQSSRKLLGAILETDYDKEMPHKDITVVVNSLVEVLNSYVRQNQQLKLKNMILTSNSGDLQSRYEVEENLKKQQFERMKCQLFLEKENLLKKLQLKDGKVLKYKNKIIEKNREINRLMRILNEHSILDTSQTSFNGGGSVNSSTGNAHGRASPPAAKQKPHLSRNKEKASDMLRTLGMLASQVLNDEADDDSANQTIVQANNSGNRAVDCNTTEPEIFHSPNVSAGTQNSDSINQMRGTPEPRSSSVGANCFLKQLPIQMPKMKRFSTVDGTVKDIE